MTAQLKKSEEMQKKLNECECPNLKSENKEWKKSNDALKSKLAENRLQNLNLMKQTTLTHSTLVMKDKVIDRLRRASANHKTKAELVQSYNDKLKVKENEIQRLHGDMKKLKNNIEKGKTESRKLRSDLWKKKKEETEKHEQNTINDWYSHQGSEKKLELSEDHANKTLSFLKTDGHEHCTETSGWITLDDRLEKRSSGLKRPRFDK